MDADTLALIYRRLELLQLGGCTCCTKTPVLEQHAGNCHYRLAAEVEDLLRKEEKLNG